MAKTSISFIATDTTINSITLKIRSTGDNLNNWQYNCFWNKDDSWIDCTLESQGDYSTFTITKISESPAPGKPLNPCTIYGVSLRAKNENTGTWVTSLHKNIKTKGEAKIKSVEKYTIWETGTMSWEWSIHDVSQYVYDVYVLNDDDDPIIKLYEDLPITKTSEQQLQEATLTTEQNNALRTGIYKLHVNTKDSLGNIVGMSEENITISMTSDPTRLKPIFDDFTITPDQDVKKGFTEVTLDYGFKAMAKDGATIKNYIITINGNDEHQDTSTIGVYSFIPDTAGSNTIQITAVDTKDRSTSVTKNISVDDYEPIKIDTVTIKRNFSNNKNIDIKMEVTSYTTPTSLKYTYRKVSNGEWNDLQDLGSSGWNLEENNKYSRTITDLPTINEMVDILVYLVVGDGISKDYTNPFIYVKSNNIISINVSDSGTAIVKVNEQGIMEYLGQLSDLNSDKDGGIYATDSNTVSIPPEASGNEGFLEVITSPNKIMERLTVYHTNDNNRYDVFIRFKINSNYTSWQQIYKQRRNDT